MGRRAKKSGNQIRGTISTKISQRPHPWLKGMKKIYVSSSHGCERTYQEVAETHEGNSRNTKAKVWLSKLAVNCCMYPIAKSESRSNSLCGRYPTVDNVYVWLTPVQSYSIYYQDEPEDSWSW
ncbi:hypothetical protein GWK48_07615 [Metallosphaera tengchongensis]|uniref:Uncharacterized protein n=1 Tax=Metallosphaera tengchongensis TaxID=1532350 RepID=A0A6N0NSW5_9CREN|nr:hypothetical protein [Metallosphaera tengchongensis]QKQ98992.1 hypothetical protein GWK48_07615 [Metallosphaera tengchongensis]